MNFYFLTKTALFRGCSQDAIQEMAEYLDFRTVRFRKGSIIYEAGTVITDIGLVLSGSVQMSHHDFWGNKSILSIANAGDVFAEAYACIPNERLIIHVTANENCEILFISVPKMFAPCSIYGSQNLFIRNLMIISAQKNLQLSKHSLHTAPKTIRGRLLSYFSQLIAEQDSRKVVTPFDRQQLADYLNLDRSALSKELGKMKRDGLLDYHKNTFTLNKTVSMYENEK